jgi:cell division protein FtsB
MTNRTPVRSDISYSPDFVGADARNVAEREFMKLQSVIAQLANTVAMLEKRIEKLESP